MQYVIPDGILERSFYFLMKAIMETTNDIWIGSVDKKKSVVLTLISRYWYLYFSYTWENILVHRKYTLLDLVFSNIKGVCLQMTPIWFKIKLAYVCVHIHVHMHIHI